MRSRLASAALCAAAMGCASSTSNAPAGPAPAASRTAGSAAAAPAVRRGAVVYQPMAATAYVLERYDTVNVQLPNGLPQTQTLSRTAYLTVATAAGNALGLDLVHNPTSVATPQVGFRTTIWYWNSRGLNTLADRNDLVGITRRINGGTNGLDARRRYFERAKQVLGA